MSFDIHGALRAVKLYGLLLVLLFIAAVLQPQKLLAVSGGEWSSHIGADLWLNLLAIVAVTAGAYFLDVFEVRQRLPKR